MNISDKANQFQRLHQGDCFVMTNAWNAGSAFMLEQGSFTFSEQQIPDAELSRLFSDNSSP